MSMQKQLDSLLKAHNTRNAKTSSFVMFVDNTDTIPNPELDNLLRELNDLVLSQEFDGGYEIVSEIELF